jgi:hypothetical protein
MSSLFGAGGSATGALVGSVVAGVVLAGVVGVSLTSVAKDQLLGSDTQISDVNAPRYADQ